MKFLFDFIGRLGLSLIFVVSSAHKLLDWNGSYNYFLGQITFWEGLSQYPLVQQSVEFALPFASLLFIVAVVFEGLGGLLLLIGFKPRFGSLLLVLFLIPVTLVCHPFWLVGDADRDLQTILFLKNIAILGGLLLFLTHGGAPCAKKQEA